MTVEELETEAKDLRRRELIDQVKQLRVSLSVQLRLPIHGLILVGGERYSGQRHPQAFILRPDLR